MNLYHFTIKVLRKIVRTINRKSSSPRKSWTIHNPQEAQNIIYETLSSSKPCMIARFGATEMSAFTNYLGVISANKKPLKVILNKVPQWWWNKSIMNQMEEWSGFFPATENNLLRFGKLMLDDAAQLDILGSWLDGELLVWDKIKDIPKIMLPLLEPFHSSQPWTRCLKGKRVVVVHPFAKSIAKQYARREKVFDDNAILPEFESLRIIPAVQSLGGKCDRFKDWFEALDWMKDELDREPYDVALIGCGAYGFHLAAYAKRTGHQGIHLGGSLQLLFGIRGKRWDNKNYPMLWGMPADSYSKYINEYWIRPSEEERPQNAERVEGATYW